MSNLISIFCSCTSLRLNSILTIAIVLVVPVIDVGEYSILIFLSVANMIYHMSCSCDDIQTLYQTFFKCKSMGNGQTRSHVQGQDHGIINATFHECLFITDLSIQD